MQIFLTHTDTPYRTFHEGDEGLHISPSALSTFDDSHVVFAFWCHHAWGDEEGWQNFLQMYQHFEVWKQRLPHHITPLLSLEDARILSGAPKRRLELLAKWGFRTITPLWRGVHSLGGAYDTDIGLTPLGVKICSIALERGIHLDISHANPRSAKEILSLSRIYGISPLASHSNFFGLNPHPRNIDDHLAKEVAHLGGIIGISFVPSHLGGQENLHTLLSHLDYGRKLGLENHLVLGTDYDGTDTLPKGMQRGVIDLHNFHSYLTQYGFSGEFLQKLFYQNAHNYFSRKKDTQT